ncbi:MAG: signal peptide peptidase SppA [Bacteroides sp.]|jgi:protease-4|nr:signal peptide peptidase SppA [Bacteroides sp.]
MKQFFKFMFASMLGFFLTSIILLFVFIGMLSSLASFSKKEAVLLTPNSVLHLNLTNEIVDRGGGNPFESFDPMSFQPRPATGLNDLIKNLKKAKNDPNIDGIFLDLTLLQTGWSTIDEIRQSLLDFKESGKFIVAYGETYTQNAYYLGSVADKVYLHPEGAIDFRGMNSELVFFKNMLEKLGIEPQVIRHGKYKSATEPFFLEKMSPENREQVLAYVSSIWNNVLKGISDSRGLTVNHLNDVADAFNTRNAELALENQMIDGIMHRDEVLEELRERLDKEKASDIEFVEWAKYMNVPENKDTRQPRSADKIAVVYGMGNIISGEGTERSMGSERIAEAIREARLDESVKAIVFRINSPGGSALASDVILREVKLASEVKPVIASMGDVAASGGYYVACGADMIVASPNTITGSIGVFGLIPNMQNFFNNKLGITFDNVKTNDYADLMTISRPLTLNERAMIQEGVEQVYTTFIGHVAEGRGIPVAQVDSIGQGRVWSGAEAVQIGLVDELGGLNYAIEKAAEKAGLENYRLVEYPSRKDFFTQIMEDLGQMQEVFVKRKLGEAYQYYKQVDQVNEMTGILTRMPYDVVIR